MIASEQLGPEPRVAPSWRALALDRAPVTGRELVWVAAVLTALAAAIFGEHVLRGGFYSDDWSLAAAVDHPRAYGHDAAVGYLTEIAGSRIAGAVYWLTTHELFGLHAKPFLVLAAGLGVVMSLALYWLARELGLPRLPAFAIAALTLLFPPADAVRLWATPALSQLAMAAYFAGVGIALRAFAATDGHGRRRHAGSLGLYAVAASITENVVPLIAVVSPLLYLTRARPRQAARRWLADLVLAAVAAGLVVMFTTAAPERAVRGPSAWLEQAGTFADQTVTLFAEAMAPYGGARWLVLVVCLAIAVAAALTIRRTAPHAARELRWWLGAAGLAVVGIAAGYAIYLPADPYYYPLQQGLAGRVNVAVAAPFALLCVALPVLAALVASGGRAGARRLALVAAGAYCALLAGFFADRLASDIALWDRAAREQYRVVNRVTELVPRPPRDATLFVFGAPGTVTPGLPVFFHDWELRGALQATYDAGDINGQPVIEGRGVKCLGDRVTAIVVDTAELLAQARYGRAVFVDVAGGKAEIVDDHAECMGIVAGYPPGPYSALRPAGTT